MSSHPPYTFAEATSRDLERLSKMERTKNKYYKCTICNFKTGTLRCLNNHLRRFHNDKTPYICTECSYSSTNLRALNVHINHHFAKETYRCSQCTYSTACNSDLLSHIEIHKSKKYKCDICRSLFSKQESFSKHKLDNHTVFPFNQTAKCKFCDDQFTNKYNKKLHLMTHEHKNKKFHKCNRCIYMTLSVKQFKKHMDEHKFNRLFICNDCSKSFPLKKLLVQHRSNFHYEINN
ncbi:hypothetical protein G9C98_004847 [Cotesia typhae]|uniref:C2H2-type domain-containing protein n=2 Tax=Cotesia typhae TaxID=2053667 RepID=A0A8J5QUN9_9HYME|nr:hypothetical protein G9C98_004847 [Cotesia typhae]